VIGAIAGDIIGSVYEFRPIKTKVFPLFRPDSDFTDDSVLTVAIAQAILTGRAYSDTVRQLGREYLTAGYAPLFMEWLLSDNPRPYNSFGNGSAMRVSPVGFAYERREEVLREAARTAEFTHSHPEGIKGAQATALAIHLARAGASKKDIRREIGDSFGYDLGRTLSEIRPDYEFFETCQRTVPEAIISFLESESWEDAVRNAISLGGDSDTLACITGGIAEAFYGGVPERVQAKVRKVLPPELWATTEKFCEKYVRTGPTSRSTRTRHRRHGSCGGKASAPPPRPRR
jgi:ADP-ribosylglycohydrolase